MRRVMFIAIVMVASGFVMQPAWAARTRFHDAAESQLWREKAGGMIGRGLLNVITSPIDVLVQTVNESKVGPPVIGTLTGFGRGIGCGVLRLGSGVVDVVTFWVPGFNGFPVSDSYEHCGRTGGQAKAPALQLAPVVSIPASTPIVIEAAPAPIPTETVKREPATIWKK